MSNRTRQSRPALGPAAPVMDAEPEGQQMTVQEAVQRCGQELAAVLDKYSCALTYELKWTPEGRAYADIKVAYKQPQQ